MRVTAPIQHLNHNTIHLKQFQRIAHSVLHLQLWLGV